jgi:hypothetical protein
MPDTADARPWRVYRSTFRIRVTRRIIPPAERRKFEEEVGQYPADLDWHDAKALAQLKFGNQEPKRESN